MIVTPLDLSQYPACLLPDSSTRSPGLHLTDIIRDMANVSGIGKDSGFSEESLDWFAGPGFLWERIWDQAHREAVDSGEWMSPGEFTLDGITGTPDRIDWSRPAVIETKVRWKSAYKFDSLEKEFWAEVTQLKSYCWMTKIMEGDLVAFFVAGNWRPPVPVVRGVNLKFNEYELEECWAGIVGHARWRKWLP
jgi:hypothetical protein